ncbi:MAG: hypothetical protein GEU28_06645 [Dehalococcoidia bacterium]|nr:hypothetical protein [Dehalococcoidia bacterium]
MPANRPRAWRVRRVLSPMEPDASSTAEPRSRDDTVMGSRNSTYVALDLETTGTNPQNDRIIEIGAIKFTPDGMLDTFSTLVDPGRSLPFRVHVLTGIAEADLRDAPPIETVALDLARFIDGLPLVGQSIGFDAAFLAVSNIAHGPLYDTFELASLFLPEAREYGLAGLAAYFDIPFAVHHRALSDAEAAREVFLALRQRLGDMPPRLLEEAVRLSANLNWPLRGLLDEILGGPQLLRSDASESFDSLLMPDRGDEQPVLSPRGSSPPPTPEDSLAYLAHAQDDEVVDGFERRPQQLAMTERVAESFQHGEHLMVEAGTGTGKSLAYLVPAALHAIRRGERVVISTDTINLQEQLVGKDLAALRKIIAAERGAGELRASTMKGRRNYLCLLRWAQARRQPAATVAELSVLIRLLIWAPHTATGDRSELNISQEEQSAWDGVSAQNENCLAGPCYYVKQGTCFLLKARKRAEASHLLVVNHALLLSDVAAGGAVLPQYDHLIVDEAHNLEDEATATFGFRASASTLGDLLDSLAPVGRGKGGLLGVLRAALRGRSLPLSSARLALLPDEIEDFATRARSASDRFFAALAEVIVALSADQFGRTAGFT